VSNQTEDDEIVETLRKPSTGLKLVCVTRHIRSGDRRDTQKTQHGIETSVPCITESKMRWVETLRKPSTGLKLEYRLFGFAKAFGRDTQKTQHGIETVRGDSRVGDQLVETLRKPSTGLKLDRALDGTRYERRDTQKTQHGIETLILATQNLTGNCRDTQKTQHGIETSLTFK